MITVAAMAVGIATVARSGHESPVYPSYYPHEIELVAVAPERAAELLLTGKIQAYVGRAPHFAAPPPEAISSIESLGSIVIVRVNPSSPLAKDGLGVCTVADIVVRDLIERRGELILHPYPVTPLHGDYLHHADLAEAAKAHVLGSGAALSGSNTQRLKVKPVGDLARSLVRPEWHAQDPEWDAEVVEVGAAELGDTDRYSMNGWLGPAWIKTGWFQTFLLLGGSRDTGEESRSRVEAQLDRLQRADYGDAVERINLERSFVASLAGGCHARAAGYTVKREYFSTVFTAGIENIAYDSIDGFNSPMFIRTVKLKDFPWNGWLALGIDAPPIAAWNPIGGFTDGFGRLLWSAVGDPALIPSPYESAWMLNRISDVQSTAKPRSR